MAGKALTLLAVVAHPDDESIGFGGTLARYARESVRTCVIIATRGERGRIGGVRARPSDPRHVEELGRAREAEARAACETLGVREVHFLGYPDGALDGMDHAKASAGIAAHVRRIRPQVVLTSSPFGDDGHPDHVAVSQFVTAAVLQAAVPGLVTDAPPHVVSKLYYLAVTADLLDSVQAALGPARYAVDGLERCPVTWPPWAVTATVDTRPVWRTVRTAVQCHATQIAGREGWERLDECAHAALWGAQRYYRAMSLVNGGRAAEDDLFAGLR